MKGVERDEDVIRLGARVAATEGGLQALTRHPCADVERSAIVDEPHFGLVACRAPFFRVALHEALGWRRKLPGVLVEAPVEVDRAVRNEEGLRRLGLGLGREDRRRHEGEEQEAGDRVSAPAGTVRHRLPLQPAR